jgi:hypothetical protein
VISSRSGNAADARPPPRLEGLPPRKYPNSYVDGPAESATRQAAAECEVIFARALSAELLKRGTAPDSSGHVIGAPAQNSKQMLRNPGFNFRGCLLCLSAQSKTRLPHLLGDMHEIHYNHSADHSISAE